MKKELEVCRSTSSYQNRTTINPFLSKTADCLVIRDRPLSGQFLFEAIYLFCPEHLYPISFRFRHPHYPAYDNHIVAIKFACTFTKLSTNTYFFVKALASNSRPRFPLDSTTLPCSLDTRPTVEFQSGEGSQRELEHDWSFYLVFDAFPLLRAQFALLSGYSVKSVLLNSPVFAPELFGQRVRSRTM